MTYRNPFTPSFGIVPACFAGRDMILNQMAQGFRNGVGDPNLATVLIGARGSGKTALLSCIGDEARNAGWIVADTVASPGMLEDILERTLAEAQQVVNPPETKHLTGVDIGQLFGLQWENTQAERGNWRTRMTSILDALGEAGTGLLITVDEIDPDVDELIQLASVYQLFVREKRSVAIAMAGLPKNAVDLVDNKRITFLRRARKRHLDPIGDADVKRAIRQSFEATGKSIAENLLDQAASEIGGFPYMMQLVGYNIWAECGDSPSADKAALEKGIAIAQEEFKENVLRSTLNDMSKGDIAFACAMLPDEDASSLSEVAARMSKGANYASTYKTRLLKQGVIEDLGGARFRFCLPGFANFLAESASMQ